MNGFGELINGIGSRWCVQYHPTRPSQMTDDRIHDRMQSFMRDDTVSLRVALGMVRVPDTNVRPVGG
jgi:hypothetical protein